MNAVNAVRSLTGDPAVNPFDRIGASITAAEAAVARVKDQLLPAVVSNLTTFNGLYYNNASLAMRVLLTKVGACLLACMHLCCWL